MKGVSFSDERTENCQKKMCLNMVLVYSFERGKPERFSSDMRDETAKQKAILKDI